MQKTKLCVKLTDDRERERGWWPRPEREIGVILPVRSYDQRSAGTIRVTWARPIREMLHVCENLWRERAKLSCIKKPRAPV